MLLIIDMLILAFFVFFVEYIYLYLPQYAFPVYSGLVILCLLYYKIDKVDLALSEERRDYQSIRSKLKVWYIAASIAIIAGISVLTFQVLPNPKEIKEKEEEVKVVNTPQINSDPKLLEKINEIEKTLLNKIKEENENQYKKSTAEIEKRDKSIEDILSEIKIIRAEREKAELERRRKPAPTTVGTIVPSQPKEEKEKDK